MGSTLRALLRVEHSFARLPSLAPEEAQSDARSCLRGISGWLTLTPRLPLPKQWVPFSRICQVLVNVA